MASDFFDDGLAMTLDGGQVESADDLYAANRVTKEGYYHVTATGASGHSEDGKLPTFNFDLMTLDGTDFDGNQLLDQIEKLISHRIYRKRWTDKAKTEQGPLEDKEQKRIRAFAYAFGLISEADLANPNVVVHFDMIEGRQAIVKVTRDKDWTDSDGRLRKGNLKIAWNSDAWPVNHERVKDVHKNREALALLAGVGVATGAASDADLNDI